ncbi:MAG: TRAPP subunit bet5 [Icmadophila ericetorum]|nr:TRAPP subunit bet5 [Icmadophila ericetorum]
MVVYSFYIFDRHAECIYKKKWLPPPSTSTSSSSTTNASSLVTNGTSTTHHGPGPGTGKSNNGGRAAGKALSDEDDAKLIFGTVFSLRGLVRKLGGPEDSFISYRTGLYKLHYYETPTSLKFVMVTDTKTGGLRVVLHQIYVGLYVEYVVKNPLSPVEHPRGVGVNCELFELGLEQFINGLLQN